MDAAKTGKLIRELRIEKGLTQQELASLLKVSATAVSKWENGRGLPDISMLEPLARVFNVTFAEIILGERAAQAVTETETTMDKTEETGGAANPPVKDQTEAVGTEKTPAEDKAEAAIKSVIDEAIIRKEQSARFGTVMMAIIMVMLAVTFIVVTVIRQKQNTPSLDLSKLSLVSPRTEEAMDKVPITVRWTIYEPYTSVNEAVFENLLKGLGVDDPAKLGKVIAHSSRIPHGVDYYCTLEGADGWLLMFHDDGKGGIPSAETAVYLYCTQESLEHVPDWVKELHH